MGLFENLFGGHHHDFKERELEIIERLVKIIERQEREIERLTKLIPPPVHHHHAIRLDVIFN